MPVLERTTAIVAGAGGGVNLGGGASAGATPSIAITSSDVVIALGLIPAATSAFSVSSPSNPNWQQRFFASLSPFFVYLWTLENPVPANEPITFTRPAAGSGMGVVQVYSGVGQIANVVQGTAVETSNPSLSPVVTATIPGSMIVGGFSFNRGSGQAFAASGERTTIIGANYSALLADQTISTPSSVQISIPYTTSTPPASSFAATVVLEPAGEGPVTPPEGIPAIVDAIKAWRKQAQVNKIYLMPPAQRAAALAELKTLAQQLKQAQIAQLKGG